LAFALVSTMDEKETTNEERACGLLIVAVSVLLKKVPQLEKSNNPEMIDSYHTKCALNLRKLERLMMNRYLQQVQTHVLSLKKK
jgi:hypothetical protein